jgi:hypothetical protein
LAGFVKTPVGEFGASLTGGAHTTYRTRTSAAYGAEGSVEEDAIKAAVEVGIAGNGGSSSLAGGAAQGFGATLKGDTNAGTTGGLLGGRAASHAGKGAGSFLLDGPASDAANEGAGSTTFAGTDGGTDSNAQAGRVGS